MSLSVNSVFKVEPLKRDQLHVLGIQGEYTPHVQRPMDVVKGGSILSVDIK